MRLTLLVVCLLPLAASKLALAEDGERRAEVAAAIADARSSLVHDVLSTELSTGYTVEQLLRQSGAGVEPIRQLAANADQVGGTRWIDDSTCQVRLELEGRLVRDVVLHAAEGAPGKLSMPLSALKKRLTRWDSRTFSGSGSSTTFTAADQLQPSDQQQAWSPVGEQPRRKAVDEARRDAVLRVLDSIRPITMPDGKAIGDALEDRAVDERVEGWLQNRPITSVEFRDDLQVRLTLGVDPHELWIVLRDALTHQKAVALPAGEAGWKRLRDQVERRMAPGVGYAAVAAPAAATRVAPLLPDQPPAWVADTVDAEGTSRSVGPLLRTARAAEAIADEKLASKLADLPLSAGVTLGDAAHRDPRISEALSRAVGRARPFKVSYNDPAAGAVRVKVSLPLADLWRELTAR